MPRILASFTAAASLFFVTNQVAFGALYAPEAPHNKYHDLQEPAPKETITRTYNEITQICKKHSRHIYPIHRKATGETFAGFRFPDLPEDVQCAGADEEVFLSRHQIKLILGKIKYTDPSENKLVEESLLYFKDHIARNVLLKADEELNGFACTGYERMNMHFSFTPIKKACPENGM